MQPEVPARFLQVHLQLQNSEVSSASCSNLPMVCAGKDTKLNYIHMNMTYSFIQES